MIKVIILLRTDTLLRVGKKEIVCLEKALGQTKYPRSANSMIVSKGKWASHLVRLAIVHARLTQCGRSCASSRLSSIIMLAPAPVKYLASSEHRFTRMDFCYFKATFDLLSAVIAHRSLIHYDLLELSSPFQLNLEDPRRTSSFLISVFF
jgi:hypothetical protein